MRITLDDAVTILKSGRLVAIPTETVYGLAAYLGSPQAVEAVFHTKKRPHLNPLILHVASVSAVAAYASFIPAHFETLAHTFWPGPLTMILQVNVELIPAIARAHLPTAAFRIPSHPETIKLLEHISPLVAPSCNLSGSPSATKRAHVEADFGLDFPVLDGGDCQHGVESTIIFYQDEQWQIVRKGAISQEELASVLGYTPPFADSSREKPLCPGQLYKHYAPRAKLILSTDPLVNKSHVIGFTDREYLGVTKRYSLGKSDSAEEAAHNLYDILRALDHDSVSTCWVDMNMPTSGLWQTVHERLVRAAMS